MSRAERRRLDGAKALPAGPNHVEVGEAFGLHWLNGHEWGVAHPEANCYADDSCAHIGSDGSMMLDVALRPQEHHGRIYPWAVGLVRSAETVSYGRLTVDFRLPLGRGLQPAVWLYGAGWPPEIDVVEGWSMWPRWWMPRHSLYRRGLLTDKVHPSLIVADSTAASGVRALRGGCPRAALWHGLLDVGGLNRAVMEWTPERLRVSYNGRRVMQATAERHPSFFAALNAAPEMLVFLNNYTVDGFGYDEYTAIERRFCILNLEYLPL